MASLIFFTVLNVVLVGILWMGLTAAQSSITGVACLTSGTKAAPDFTLRTWDTPSGQTITLSTLKNRVGQPAP